MTDRDNLSFQPGDEEEFHITDEDIDRELAAMDADQSAPPVDEPGSESVAEKPSAKSGRFTAFKKLKRKHWIIILIIVLILFFGLIKFMGNTQPSPSLEPIAPVQIPKKSISLPEMSKRSTETGLSSNTLSEVVLSPSPNNDLPRVNPIVVASNSAPSHDDEKLTRVLTEIQKQNQLLQQQLASLSQRVVGLESELNRSTSMTGMLPSQTSAITPTNADTSAVMSTPSMLPPEPTYTVEAVVPQRAWIQTSDGNTLTLAIGDEVPGLGAVTAIDPYSGNVTTASGTIIKYAN